MPLLWRFYTGPDNESHLEEIDLDQHPELRPPSRVTNMRLMRAQAGRFVDFHPAPERRWSINLEGEVEVGFGDGAVRRFVPGQLRLIEDTTGRGHTTRYLSDTTWLMISVED